MNSLKKTYLSSVARLALAVLIGTAALSLASPANARNFNVANDGQLRNAITSAQNGDTITFTGNVTLSANLPNVQKSVTINGGNFALSGNAQYRGLFVQSGTVTITNLTIANAKAQGGNGGKGFYGLGNSNAGGGGGGGGLGGALFVASGANVTVSNVNLKNNQARGGNGGVGRGTANPFQLHTSGGGGSMFGNGGDGGLSLDGNGAPDGGMPGYGGGKEGGSDGGFGGGGGGAATTRAGNGGFSGGGGSGMPGGKGGNGGGDGGFSGSNSVGGGGAGMGGAIFVQQGGTLELTGPLTISGNSVAGGTGNQNGQAYGSGIFLQGNGSVTLAPGAGQSQSISDAMADQTGVSGSGGSWSLIKNGAGTTRLTGANAYSGGTTVNAGVLQGTTTSLQGNIIDNASVVFYGQARSGTYAGKLSGTGSLTKTGIGTVALTGTNTYSGGTTVNQAILFVQIRCELGRSRPRHRSGQRHDRDDAGLPGADHKSARDDHE